MNKKKAKLLIALVVIVGGIGGLVYSALQSTMTYYMTPTEIQAKAQAEPAAVYGERVRVGGMVIDGTVKGSASSREWEFLITDFDEKSGMESVAMKETTPESRVKIRYTGILPDTFKEGVIAIADGALDEKGVFTADTVLAKCPSKYEEEGGDEGEIMSTKGAADKEAGLAVD
jgi:cytochrome c-type biogenesis protein CcmE